MVTCLVRMYNSQENKYANNSENENFVNVSDLIWASSWDYGTYHIGDQWRFRPACTSAQFRQSVRCLHTHKMEADEASDQKSDL